MYHHWPLHMIISEFCFPSSLSPLLFRFICWPPPSIQFVGENSETCLRRAAVSIWSEKQLLSLLHIRSYCHDAASKFVAFLKTLTRSARKSWHHTFICMEELSKPEESLQEVPIWWLRVPPAVSYLPLSLHEGPNPLSIGLSGLLQEGPGDNLTHETLGYRTFWNLKQFISRILTYNWNVQRGTMYLSKIDQREYHTFFQ